jgi:hypothetical protein
MKVITLIIVLLFTSLCALAQAPQLFENPWYLQKIVIDDEDLFPPNDGLADIDNYFLKAEGTFAARFCDGINQPITYSGTDSFTLDDNPAFLVGFCDDPISRQYDDAYFSIFFENRMTSKNPFNYTFDKANGLTTLIITNAEGDKAFYGNEVLSVTDLSKVTVHLFPNPAKEQITIASNYTTITNITIFNVQGQEVMTLQFQQNEQPIDISSLQAGVYFLKANSDTGQQFLAKFVKQ